MFFAEPERGSCALRSAGDCRIRGVRAKRVGAPLPRSAARETLTAHKRRKNCTLTHRSQYVILYKHKTTKKLEQLKWWSDSMVHLGNDWDEILAGEFEQDYYKRIRYWLKKE